MNLERHAGDCAGKLLYIVIRQRAGAVAYPVAAFDALIDAQTFAAVADRTVPLAWHRVSAVPHNPRPFNRARLAVVAGSRPETGSVTVAFCPNDGDLCRRACIDACKLTGKQVGYITRKQPVDLA